MDFFNLPVYCINEILTSLDTSDLVAFTQVCRFWRCVVEDHLGYLYFLKIQNPLWSLDATDKSTWKECYLAQRSRDREKVVFQDPLSTPTCVRYLPISRNVLPEPGTFWQLGRRNRDLVAPQWFNPVQQNSWEYRERLREGKAEDFAFHASRNSPYGTLVSRYGMSIDAAESDTVLVTTPQVLAIMRQTTPPAKLHITYKSRPRASHISFMSGKTESYKLIAIGEIVVLRIVSISERIETFVYNYMGESRVVFQRKCLHHLGAEKHDFFIYDGYIWEIARLPHQSRLVIQTLQPSNQPQIAIPYSESMDNNLPAVQDSTLPHFVLIFGHTEAQYLVNMITKEVFTWSHHLHLPRDCTIVGKQAKDKGLTAYTFSESFVSELNASCEGFPKSPQEENGPIECLKMTSQC